MSDLPNLDYSEPAVDDAVATAPIPPAPQEYIEPPPAGYGARMIDARLNGHSWDDVDGYLNDSTRKAYGQGYSQDDVNSYLGVADRDQTQNRMAADAYSRLAHDDQFAAALAGSSSGVALLPSENMAALNIAREAGWNSVPPSQMPTTDFIEPPPSGLPLYDEYSRSSYARSLLNDEVRSPRDFAERYAGAFGAISASDPGGLVRAAGELASALPSDRDFTDQAIAIAGSSGLSVDGDTVKVIRNNLVNQWSDTGQPLMDIYKQAQSDPDLASSLVTEKQPPKSMIEQFADIPNAELMQHEEMSGWVVDRLKDWYAWRLAQPDATQEGWDKAVQDAHEALTTGKLSDEALNTALGFVGGNIENVGAKFGEAIGLLGKIPEPMVKVLDPAAEGGVAGQVPIAKAFEPIKPAERPPVEPVAEGAAPKEPPSPLDFVPEAKPEEKIEAITRDVADGNPEVLGEIRARNDGVMPKESDPDFYEKLAAGQDQATVELAQGHDTARGLVGNMIDTFTRLMADDSGALKLWNTTVGKTASDLFKQTREEMQNTIIRREGQGDRLKTIARNIVDPTWNLKTVAMRLDNVYKMVQPHMKEWTDELAKGIDGDPMNTFIGELHNYMSGRSADVTMSPGNPLAPVADTMRDVAKFMEGYLKIATNDGVTTLKSFFEDFFPQHWKNTNAARQLVEEVYGAPGKLGSGGHLQQRQLSFAEGIARGLQPIDPNPISAMMRYVDSTVNHVQSRYMLKDLEKQGLMYWDFKPNDPSLDVKLEGPGLQRAIPMQKPLQYRQAEAAARDQLRQGIASGAPPATIANLQAIVAATTKAAEPEARVQYAFANRGGARAWNQWLGRVVYGDNVGSGIYEKLLFAKNAATQLSLINPSFHGMGIVWETGSSGIGKAVSEFARGEVGHGAKDLAMSAGILPKAGETYMSGLEAMRRYASGHPDPIIQLGTDAGMQFTHGRPIEYAATRTPGYLEAMAHEGLIQNWKDRARHVIEADPNGDVSLGKAAWRATEAIGSEFGRMAHTTSALIMDNLIPTLKAGTFYERMGDAIRQNPTMTEAQKLAKAREIRADVDNRLGEQNMKTVFWPNWVKKTAALTMISPTWLYGFLRFAGSATGSIANIATLGKVGTFNETALTNMIAYGAVTMGGNMLYQYAKTGTWPWSSGRSGYDAYVPWSGGHDPKTGDDERFQMPGLSKEVHDLQRIGETTYANPWHFGEAMAHYALSRGAIPFQMGKAFLTGEDAIGHHVTAGNNFPAFVAKMFTPIFMSTMEGRKIGSGISRTENWLGGRPAGPAAANPSGFIANERNRDRKDELDDYKRQVRENQYLETPRELPEEPEGPEKPERKGRQGTPGGHGSYSNDMFGKPSRSRGGSTGRRSYPGGM